LEHIQLGFVFYIVTLFFYRVIYDRRVLPALLLRM